MIDNQITIELLKKWRAALHTQYQIRGDAIVPRNSIEAPTIEQMSLIRSAHYSIIPLIDAYLAAALPTQTLRETGRPAMGDDVVRLREALEKFIPIYEAEGWSHEPEILNAKAALAAIPAGTPIMGENSNTTDTVLEMVAEKPERPTTNSPAKITAPSDAVVAIRYGWDGHGYHYIDNASGSDWQQRYPDGEPLYLNAPAPTEDVVKLRKVVLLAARWFKLYQEDETRYEHPASDADLLGMYDKMIAALNQRKPGGEF